jgi:membrane protease YdiL (CAAX protease family)
MQRLVRSAMRGMRTKTQASQAAMVEPDELEPSAPKPNWSKPALWAALALACALLIFGAIRLTQIEQREGALESEPRTLAAARELPTATRLSARLLELPLQREQRATFELCALADLHTPVFQDAFELLIMHAEAGKLMLRVPLDAAHLEHVQGDKAQSCLLLGSGLIENTGTYRIEAVWPKQAPPDAAQAATLWVRVQASPELSQRDLLLVCGLGAAVLLCLMLTLRRLPAPQPVPARTSLIAIPGHAPLLDFVAPLLALALLYVAMQWPSRGGLHTLFKGCGLLALQLAVPLLLIARGAAGDKSSALGLTRLTRPVQAALLAIVAVPMLVAAARLSMRVVPSTEIAPIQTFIAWPSGMLSAALLGVILPVGEELFFRGYLFGAWLRFGRTFAAVASVLVFGLMHLAQSWGNWGGLLAIFMTGAVLCGLRLLTGSACLPAISHVAYNLTLSASTLAAAVTD